MRNIHARNACWDEDLRGHIARSCREYFFGNDTETARTASAFQPAVLFHLMSDFNDFNGGRHHERILGL